jgi:hypothetical protein|nr:MAG TPA: hypothetical protein [Caudoviricetes sp.]
MEKVLCNVAMEKERKERVEITKLAIREVLGG